MKYMNGMKRSVYTSAMRSRAARGSFGLNSQRPRKKTGRRIAERRKTRFHDGGSTLRGARVPLPEPERFVAAVVALAGPRGEDKQDARARRAGHGAALVGLESEQGALAGVEALDTRFDANVALDDDEKRGLLDLVVAELLAGVDSDEDGTRCLCGREHDRRSRPSGRLDLA